MNTKNKKTIMLCVLTAVFIVAVAIIVISLTGNNSVAAVNDIENSSGKIVEDDVKIADASAETVAPEQEEKPADTLSEPERIRPQTARPTTATEKPKQPMDTTMTLAPVSTLSPEAIEIMEDHQIDIVETAATFQTTPPPSEQQTPNSTTDINGQKHVWNPILGWCPDYGEGTVIIMDVEDLGDREQYEGGWS